MNDEKGLRRRSGTGPVELRYAQDDLFADSYSRPELLPGDGDYYTPREYAEAIHATYGGPPDMDPATCAQANGDAYGRGIHARLIYDQRDDGLAQPWYGKVWLNPPFGQWELWVPKIVAELRSGAVTELMAYCTVSSLTNKALLPLKERCSALMISHGRPNCWGPRSGAAPDGVAVLYFGLHPEKFRDCWGHLGQIFRPA